MANKSTTNLRIFERPVDERTYEKGWKEILKTHFKCEDVQLVGRKGQSQYGLDVIGFRIKGGEKEEIGVQCKLKSTGTPLTKAEVEEEIDKLLARPIALPTKYYIVSTSLNDVKMLEAQSAAEQKLKKEGKSIPRPSIASRPRASAS